MPIRLSQLLNEHLAIIGKTRSGKTTFASWLYRHLPKGSKAVFINTQVEDSIDKYSDITTNELTPDVLVDYDRINYIPPIDLLGNTTDLTTEIKLIFAHQRLLAEKGLLHPFFVFIDEAQEYAPRGKPNPLRPIWKRGLRFDLHGVAITQRPTDVDKTILTQSRYLVIFGINQFEIDVFRHYGMAKIYQDFEKLKKRLTNHRFAVYDTIHDELRFFSPIRP